MSAAFRKRASRLYRAVQRSGGVRADADAGRRPPHAHFSSRTRPHYSSRKALDGPRAARAPGLPALKWRDCRRRRRNTAERLSLNLCRQCVLDVAVSGHIRSKTPKRLAGSVGNAPSAASDFSTPQRPAPDSRTEFLGVHATKIRLAPLGCTSRCDDRRDRGVHRWVAFSRCASRHRAMARCRVSIATRCMSCARGHR